MNGFCLQIHEPAVLEKLEFFIFQWCKRPYNEVDLLLNHSQGNRADMNRQDCFDYNQFLDKLQPNRIKQTITQEELNELIDIFLLLLRTNRLEVSFLLKPLLDAIIDIGDVGKEWRCIRRIQCVLAAIYVLYFLSDSVHFLNKKGEVRGIFNQSMGYLTLEDKRFLTSKFFSENYYDGLVDILKDNLRYFNYSEHFGKEAESIESIFLHWFKWIIKKYSTSKKYTEGLFFLDECEYLFQTMSIECRNVWLRFKSSFLLEMKQYEQAKAIDELIKDNNNPYALYNKAVCIAWAANRKEKEESEADIKLAMELLSCAERLAGDKSKIKDNIKQLIMFEESYFFAEMKKYDESFSVFESAWNSADEHTKIASNFNTHIWILLSYLYDSIKKAKVKNPSNPLCNADNSCVAKRWGDVSRWIDTFSSVDYIGKLGDYKAIIDFVKTDEYLTKKVDLEFSDRIYKDLLLLQFHAQGIIHTAKIRDTSQYNMLYYTKNQHLRLLLEDEENVSCKFRLPMFHIYHMNDPQEGQMLRRRLKPRKNISYGVGDAKTRKPYDEKYVYLKSFFCYPKKETGNAAEEFLPMWVQYGDDTEGCCIILNNKTFEGNSLRKVIYLSDNGKSDDEEMNELLDSFVEVYKDLQNACDTIDTNFGEECLKTIDSLVEYIISQIAYLFKHDSYKHEREVRLIRTLANLEYEGIKVISGAIPKTYIYNNHQTYIDEVILGAKVRDPENFVPFIHKQGNKMWENSKDKQIKVTQSSIQYR